KSWIAIAAAGAAAIAVGWSASAQVPAAGGEAVFNARCKGCHDPAIERAPNRTALAAMPTRQIVDALTTGVMRPMAGGLSDDDKTALAMFLNGAPAGRQQAANRPSGVDRMCETHAPIRATASDWTSVG